MRLAFRNPTHGKSAPRPERHLQPRNRDQTTRTRSPLTGTHRLVIPVRRRLSQERERPPRSNISTQPCQHHRKQPSSKTLPPSNHKRLIPQTQPRPRAQTPTQTKTERKPRSRSPPPQEHGDRSDEPPHPRTRARGSNAASRGMPHSREGGCHE